MFRLAFLAGLFAQVEADSSHTRDSLRKSRNQISGFVRALEFKRTLRVCNAYAYEGSLDVFRGKEEKLTDSQPMNYRSCRDFEPPLHEGDKLDFRIGEASAGTFSVADLPESDAVLLLVIHRHDVYSTAVSFESHVFAHVENSQVAVIDTFKGGARSTPEIMDFIGGKRREVLRYDSVLAVHPGEYKVQLAGQDGQAVAESKLVALNHECYVVLRAGIEAHQGTPFPQELIIFPQSDPATLHSNSVRGSLAAVSLLIITFAHFL